MKKKFRDLRASAARGLLRLKTKESTLKALEKAARRGLTLDEIPQQRVSFVMSSLGVEIARGKVEQLLAEQRGYIVLADEDRAFFENVLGGRAGNELLLGSPVYQQLEVSNGSKQYDFLNSVVLASPTMGRPFLSQHIIKAFNFQAMTCLHISAGEYRPCPVSVDAHIPPKYYRIPALMDDFVNVVNQNWDGVDAVALATYVLWRLNYIHPFVNGNGRTARAAAYFALCVKSGGVLPGQTILPELIQRNREEHVNALQRAHKTFRATGSPHLAPLHAIITRLLDEQIAIEQCRADGGLGVVANTA